MRYSKRGGARVGAGRKKKAERGVSHAKRPELSGREPVHVTLRVLEHVFHLRTRRCFEIVSAALLAACSQLGFRIVALSLQGNHLHLLIEAATASALARGIQRVAIRMAKGLNRLMGRHGPVFERFHARPLKTPREVRAALGYILRNTAKHARQVGRPLPAGYRDPYTFGYFGDRAILSKETAGLVAEPESWMLRYGWRRGTAADATARVSGGTRPSPRPIRAPPALPLFAVSPQPEGPTPPGGGEHRDRGRDAPVPLAA